MTQQEFEALSGLTVENQETYDLIKAAYNRYDGEKEPFCAMWRGMSSEAQDFIIETLEEERAEKEMLSKANRDLWNTKVEYAHTLIDTMVGENMMKAKSIIGVGAYYKHMLSQGITLKPEERDELIELIG